MRTLNLGILAHVDAGKTTLTERLLYQAGVISEAGSVDQGSTQTDSLPLERQRGITIKSAVASFAVGDVTVNLIDTPGHPEFIAEVERVLTVLDGAVLVVSAVEGVQAQTRVLMRALQRLSIPALIFVNKIDRSGAQYERVLAGLSGKLTPAVVALGSVTGPGTRGAGYVPFGAGDPAFAARLAGVLAEHDDALLAAYVDDAAIGYRRLRAGLAAQARQALVHPVLFGSAITGAGMPDLAAALAELLPAAGGGPGGPVSGTVFKVERGPAGEKIAWARLFAGTVRVRDRLRFGAGETGTVTALSVAGNGAAAGAAGRAVAAGQIARLWGLGGIQVGDRLGSGSAAGQRRQFAPPTLETVVVPARRADKGALHLALTQLAEQDPLINLRQDDTRQEIHLSLYGEVQKEVIQATLADGFGLEVTFRESTTVCIERLAGTGAAVERLHQPPNPFLATVGLRIEPAAPGSGVTWRIEAEMGSMPLAFFKAVEDTVRESLRQGLCGWEVTDCAVTMTHSGYVGKHSLGHARFTKSLSSTGEDFRKLTPLVVMSALRQAGTRVHEPVNRFRLEIPPDTLAPLMQALAGLRAVVREQRPQGQSCLLEGEIPAARAHRLQQQLPALTRGEGMLECTFGRYQPVRGPVPHRPRTGPDPRDRKEYLLRATRRV